jgi:hypothetical protein
MSRVDGVLSNSKEEMVSKLRGKLVSGDFSELSGVSAAGKWPDSEVIAYAGAQSTPVTLFSQEKVQVETASPLRDYE